MSSSLDFNLCAVLRFQHGTQGQVHDFRKGRLFYLSQMQPTLELAADLRRSPEEMTASKHNSKTVNTSAQLTVEELNILNQALKELNAEVSDNHLPFLGSEGQRKRLLYRIWHDLGKAMRRPRTCIYPGCADQSAPRSHTIQKAGPLSFIAEGSHVVAPRFASNSEYSIVRVGLNDASTFPGFCQRHESVFHEFEANGEIKSERDIFLQVFRTICREIAVKQIQIEQVVKVRETHDRLVSSKGMEILKSRLGDAFVKRHNPRNLMFDMVSNGQVALLETEKELGEALEDLETQFFPASAELDGSEYSLCHVSVAVQQPLPVCLSGMANFWIDDHGKRINVRTILNVLPSRQQTLIVATTLSTHKRYLHTYLGQMLDQMNGILIMVETWMVRGTDHWFMAPSEWEAIPESRQAKILADMLDESVSIGEAYPTSVLDSVREQVLTLPDAKAEPQQIFDAEASKLTDRVIMCINSNTNDKD